MRTVIAGGSGFLGSALAAELLEEGHEVTILTRRPNRASTHARLAYAEWNPDGTSGGWAATLHGADHVVNLAGESIAARRWSTAQKHAILQSRLLATRSLTTAIRGLSRAPAAFVSASAVGYYGNRDDERLDESSAPGDDFLARVCREWEEAAADVAHLTRLAIIRTGIVLDRRGGALPKMLPPFRLFVGGPLGSGRQYMPWIHWKDWARMVAWIVRNDRARGPFNAVGPAPVTNAEFSQTLGRALNRPSFLPAPRFALRLALGEMADALLLGSQRAVPARAAELGFSFEFTRVDEALAAALK